MTSHRGGGEPATTSALRSASGAEIDAAALYALLRLRAEIFIVEQRCAYLDLDGLDLRADTLHLWYQDADGRVLGALRVLAEPGGGSRIGRVVTRREARAGGMASGLMGAAMERCDHPVLISAQSQLEPWYARLGFGVIGDRFDEDGITHTPMRLP